MLLHSGATRGGSNVTVEKLPGFYIYHKTHITTRSPTHWPPIRDPIGLCLTAVKWKGYWINGCSAQSINKQMLVYVNLHACGHCIDLPSFMIYEWVRGKRVLYSKAKIAKKKIIHLITKLLKITVDIKKLSQKLKMNQIEWLVCLYLMCWLIRPMSYNNAVKTDIHHFTVASLIIVVITFILNSVIINHQGRVM